MRIIPTNANKNKFWSILLTKTTKSSDYHDETDI